MEAPVSIASLFFLFCDCEHVFSVWASASHKLDAAGQIVTFEFFFFFPLLVSLGLVKTRTDIVLFEPVLF
jgi:hypothetical protein